MGTDTLKQQIEQLQEASKGQMPPEIVTLFGRAVEDLRSSNAGKGLSVGDNAPNFTLKDVQGKPVELYAQLKKGPVVLTFYRGEWCPYCNLQLKAYQKILPQIQELGAQLIAVNPQNPDKSLSMQEKAELSFVVLSDEKGSVSKQYNLQFDIPDYLQTVYSKMGLNLAEHNAGGEWALPVPGTLIIDSEAIIRKIFIDPDYTKRMEPQDIVDGLQSI